MASLKIRVFKNGEADPDTTVSIPIPMLKLATRLMPRQAAASLQEKGIDLEEIIRLGDNPEARGILIEVEEHKKNQRVIIAIE